MPPEGRALHTVAPYPVRSAILGIVAQVQLGIPEMLQVVAHPIPIILHNLCPAHGHSRNSGSGAVGYSRTASGYGSTYPSNTSQALSGLNGRSRYSGSSAVGSFRNASGYGPSYPNNTSQAISHSRNSGSGAADYSRNASGYGPTYPKNTSQALSGPIGHSSNASHGNRTLLYSDQRVNDLSKYIQS